jgi:hypothetical protein
MKEGTTISVVRDHDTKPTESRNTRLAADGQRHARVTEDFNECLSSGSLERVHSLRMMSIRSKAIRFHGEDFEFKTPTCTVDHSYGARIFK